MIRVSPAKAACGAHGGRIRRMSIENPLWDAPRIHGASTWHETDVDEWQNPQAVYCGRRRTTAGDGQASCSRVKKSLGGRLGALSVD